MSKKWAEREKYRQDIINSLNQLTAKIYNDDGEHAEWDAQQLHYAIRELFREERWRPLPVFEGMEALLPLETELTIKICHHAGSNGTVWVQGKLTAVQPPYRGDGAALKIIPKRCRKPVQHYYHVGSEQHIKIWKGYLNGQDVQHTTPFYEHGG